MTSEQERVKLAALMQSVGRDSGNERSTAPRPKRNNHDTALIHAGLGPQSPYPIFRSLVRYLDAVDIIRISRTCVALSGLYRRLLKTDWDVDRKLSRFFDQPVTFRKELQKVDGLISGSLALQFFDRSVWDESDLDVYIKDASDENGGEEREEVIRTFLDHLVNTERYQPVPTTAEDENYYTALDGPGRFEVSNLMRADGRKIQIMRSTSAPIRLILGRYYSTTVLNIITAEAAYCLFPHITFTKRRMLMLVRHTSDHDPLLDKYYGRGWELEPNGSPDTGFGWEKLLGDRSTWMIRFAPAGAASAATTLMEHTSICIRHDGNIDVWHISYDRLRPALVAYLALGLQQTDLAGLNQWFLWLARKLLPRIQKQLARLSVEQRPPRYDLIMSSWDALEDRAWLYRWSPVPRLQWTPPPGVNWKYYDHKVPEWFEDYKCALGTSRELYRGT